MRIMLIGQKWLGEQTLQLLQARGAEVALVCAPSTEDRLARLAAHEGVPCITATRRIDASHVPAGLDLLLCAHAHAYISRAAREKTRLGALGYHPSLLPRHRGRDAVRWAIHMREPITGGSTYWLDDGADTGPIAAQHWCHIAPDDTPETLWRRELAPLGLRLIAETLDKLQTGQVPATPQNNHLATWEPAFTPRPLAPPE